MPGSPCEIGAKLRVRESTATGTPQLLEPRTLLAGNVTATVAGADLIVQGDDFDNAMTLMTNANGNLVPRGIDDTSINGHTEFIPATWIDGRKYASASVTSVSSSAAGADNLSSSQFSSSDNTPIKCESLSAHRQSHDSASHGHPIPLIDPMPQAIQMRQQCLFCERP